MTSPSLPDQDNQKKPLPLSPAEGETPRLSEEPCAQSTYPLLSGVSSGLLEQKTPRSPGGSEEQHECTTTEPLVYPLLSGASSETNGAVRPICSLLQICDRCRTIAGPRTGAPHEGRCGPYITALTNYTGWRSDALASTPVRFVILDIDAADGLTWDTFQPLNAAHVIWRTYSSTLNGPGQRWRVVVAVRGVTVDTYKVAAGAILARCGIDAKARKVTLFPAGHPMFVPALFDGETWEGVCVAESLGGQGATYREWAFGAAATEPGARATVNRVDNDLQPPPNFSYRHGMSILWSLDPDMDYTEWYRVGLALHAQSTTPGWTPELARAAWIEWSAIGVKGDGSAVTKWDDQFTPNAGAGGALVTLRAWYGSGDQSPTPEAGLANASRNLARAVTGEAPLERLMEKLGFVPPATAGESQAPSWAADSALIQAAQGMGWLPPWHVAKEPAQVGFLGLWHMQEARAYFLEDVAMKPWSQLCCDQRLRELHGAKEKRPTAAAIRDGRLLAVLDVVRDSTTPAGMSPGRVWNTFEPYARGVVASSGGPLSPLAVEIGQGIDYILSQFDGFVRDEFVQPSLIAWEMMRRYVMEPATPSSVILAMQSAGGMGKGTLAWLIGLAIGDNLTPASEHSLGFDDLLIGRTVVVIEELPKNPRPKFLDKLKALTGGGTFACNAKNQKIVSLNHSLKLWIHTNYPTITLGEMTTRRLYFLRSQHQRPEQRPEALRQWLCRLRVLGELPGAGQAVVDLMAARERLDFQDTMDPRLAASNAYAETRDTSEEDDLQDIIESMPRGKGDGWVIPKYAIEAYIAQGRHGGPAKVSALLTNLGYLPSTVVWVPERRAIRIKNDAPVNALADCKLFLKGDRLL